MSSSTAVILGAGFSHVAGLPLATDLFESEFFVPSQAAKIRYDAVLREWRSWKSNHPNKGPEQFLTEVYRATTPTLIHWSWAAELVATILATPRSQDRGAHPSRYSGRITQPVNTPIHDAFWDVVLSRFDVKAIVTTNYDILVERGLRHRPMQRSKRPGVHYGGLARPQYLTGTALPFSVSKPERLVELEGNIPLYKLHGSLNWGLEAENLALYQDLRPAFRHGGNAQIVPPVLEKDVPSWLIGVWDGARQALASCSIWLVCGYSLPLYDKAVTQLFTTGGSTGTVARIILIDPFSADIGPRWQAVAPNADLSEMPGLPEALRPLHDAI